MTSVAQVAEKMQTILTQTAEQLGRETGFIRRERQWSGATFAQAVVFGWMGKPAASLSELSQAAANVGVDISRQGVAQRFDERAARFLKRLLQVALEEVVEGPSVQSEVLRRFRGVYLLDSTCIGLPDALQSEWAGCGGSQGASAGLKISVLWDMVSGGWSRVELMAGRTHDQRAEAAQQSLAAGSLRIADLGYFKLKELARLSREGVYWLTSYKVGTVVWVAGERVDLLAYLTSQTASIVEAEVHIGLHQRVSGRLVAHRVSPAVLAHRQADLAEWERKKQRRASPLTWALLAWDICLTNVPDDLLHAQEVLALAHYRWQIELLFKLWKSEGQLDTWRTHNPWRILCEIYAKLLALLFQHWLMLVGQWQTLDRSLTRAIRTIRQFAWQLARDLPHRRALCATLRHLVACVKRCRADKNRASPRAFQRLEALS